MPVRTLSLLTFALWAGAAHAADPVAWLIDPIDLVHGTAELPWSGAAVSDPQIARAIGGPCTLGTSATGFTLPTTGGGCDWLKSKLAVDTVTVKDASGAVIGTVALQPLPSTTTAGQLDDGTMTLDGGSGPGALRIGDTWHAIEITGGKAPLPDSVTLSGTATALDRQGHVWTLSIADKATPGSAPAEDRQWCTKALGTVSGPARYVCVDLVGDDGQPDVRYLDERGRWSSPLMRPNTSVYLSVRHDPAQSLSVSTSGLRGLYYGADRDLTTLQSGEEETVRAAAVQPATYGRAFVPRQPGAFDLTLTLEDNAQNTHTEIVELQVVETFSGAVRLGLGVNMGWSRQQLEVGTAPASQTPEILNAAPDGMDTKGELVLGYAPFMQRGGRDYLDQRGVWKRVAPYIGLGLASTQFDDVPSLSILSSAYLGAEVELNPSSSVAVGLAVNWEKGLPAGYAVGSPAPAGSTTDTLSTRLRATPALGVVLNLSPEFFKVARAGATDTPVALRGAPCAPPSPPPRSPSSPRARPSPPSVRPPKPSRAPSPACPTTAPCSATTWSCRAPPATPAGSRSATSTWAASPSLRTRPPSTSRRGRSRSATRCSPPSPTTTTCSPSRSPRSTPAARSPRWSTPASSRSTPPLAWRSTTCRSTSTSRSASPLCPPTAPPSPCSP